MPADIRQTAGTIVVGIFETVSVEDVRTFSAGATTGSVLVLVLADDLASQCLGGLPCVSGEHARAEVVAHMRGVDEVHVVGMEQLLAEMGSCPPSCRLVLAEECVRRHLVANIDPRTSVDALISHADALHDQLAV